MVAVRNIILISALIYLASVPAGSCAHDPSVESNKTLMVGTKEAPPFAMQASDGSWTGISVDLWRKIADRLDLPFEFREADLRGLLDGIVDGSLDVAVAALTVTPEREELFDFTHPFYTTGLGIAAMSKQQNPWIEVLKRFFSTAFFEVVASLSVLLLAVGILVWWFERRRNSKQFGDGIAKGIGSGFWWSAVTMTTVGYGDKAPVTVGGRIVALVWMFAGIIMISSFTAAITSSLTVTKLESPIQGPEDLPKVRVGTMGDSTSEAYLRQNRISFRVYQQPEDGLDAIVQGEIEAFVYDAPILRYLVHENFQGELQVLPRTFLHQAYGIALPEESPLREPINRVLLQEIEKPTWQDTLYRYLGG